MDAIFGPIFVLGAIVVIAAYIWFFSNVLPHAIQFFKSVLKSKPR